MERAKVNNEEYKRVNRGYEVKYMPKVKKSLDPIVSSVISAIRSGGVSEGIRDLNKGLMLNERVAKMVEQLYTEVGLRHARRNEIRLRAIVRKKSAGSEIKQKRLGFNDQWTQFIKEYLKRFLISKILFKVSETLRDSLLKIMQMAIEKGWGVDETVKRMEDLPLTKVQAARIVRSEINRAANVGVKAQSQTFEFEIMKEWVAVHDFRTRGRNPKDHANHWALDGKRLDMNEKFIDPINGDQLDHPGDPNASAESTVNCRCNLATIPKRDESGSLIPKNGAAQISIPNRRTQIFIR